ncbi:MAG TPA: PQQ-dependent sugar dehydrogenase [Kofleriaceae bacterium]|nr:PQQ-dependent sugar dehydrogenase [Kofleriaceae bacterium]
MRWIALALAVLGACGRKADTGSPPAPDPGDSPGQPAPPSAAEPEAPPPSGSAALVPVPATVAAKVALTDLGVDLRNPVGLEVAPGDRSGRLWVVEQIGRLRIVRGGAVVDRPALDIQRQVSRASEQGLLGLAFHPRFADNRKLYIDYTDAQGNTHVVEYQVAAADAEQVDLGSAREIVAIEQPFANHNGGYLEFGPDGKLYAGTGDGGAGGDPFDNAQHGERLLGKMLRFDVDAPGKPAAEVVARGLRNPWRYDFDDASGDLYIADVGQDRFEEIDVIALADLPGANFGWRLMEAGHCFKPASGCDRTGLQLPVVEYPHKEGCSITGGEVYQGKALPDLDRVYFYADFCTGLIRSLRWSRAGGVRDHWDWSDALNPGRRIKNISAFGHDAAGELYLLSLDGDVFRLGAR